MYGLDLFSGIGGITKALEGYVQPVAYCENDRYAQAVLLSRMRSCDIPRAPIWDDIRTLDAKLLLSDVEIIYGGFPCQDISVAGRGAGLEGERSGLFFEIVRLVSEIRPRFVFLENVSAITIRGAERVIGEFCRLRYDCRWGVLSASDVGANHQRARWWLLAHANGSRLEKPGLFQSNLPQRPSTAEPSDKCQKKRIDVAHSQGEINGSGYSQSDKRQIQQSGIGNGSEDVADTRCKHGDARRYGETRNAPKRCETLHIAERSSTDVADSDDKRSGIRCEESAGWTEPERVISWWSVEPNVGRVAARLPAWLDDSGGKYAHSSCIEKARTKGIPQTSTLQKLWKHRESPTPSSEPPRCLICAIPMSEVSCDGASGAWDLGKWEQEDGDVRRVRYGIYSEAIQAEQDLQSDLPVRTWTPLCEQTMASRVDRLKCLGNSVVPAQAREAFERLIGLKT